MEVGVEVRQRSNTFKEVVIYVFYSICHSSFENL